MLQPLSEPPLDPQPPIPHVGKRKISSEVPPRYSSQATMFQIAGARVQASEKLMYYGDHG